MDYYGLLFLYYLKGLSGKSVLRLFSNIEAGGTEQLLPENTSTPTTTPILADIQYPDGLRTDQYFTYRETPTTVSNKARIKTIKGNTLKWNQLVRNNQQTATVSGVAFTNNGDNSWNISGTATANITFNFNAGGFALNKQDIYFISGCPSGGSESTYSFGIGGLKNDFGNGAIWKNTPNYTAGVPTFLITNGVTVNFTNVKFIICNLTQMFGTEKAEEILAMGQTDGIAYFRSLYPLPFYSYDSGSLLSFRGEGLKTVGFNQWDEEWEVGSLTPSTGANEPSSRRIRSKNYISVIPGTTYYVKVPVSDGRFALYDANKSFIQTIPLNNQAYAIPSNCHYVRFSPAIAYGTTYNNDICINISDPSKNGTYEPYWSSTLSLPISTYFPTGMKSAGNVYDELTPTNAITRIGVVDLGTLDWERIDSYFGAYFNLINKTGKTNADLFPMLCVNYQTVRFYRGGIYMEGIDKSIAYAPGSGSRLYVADSSYTDATAFKTAMSGVYLYYELATPTETPITTEDANEALSLLMGKSVSSNNANQLINIITKGE